MRKSGPLMVICFLLRVAALGQVHTGVFNPFGFAINDFPGTMIAKDTSGLVWFAGAYGTPDSVIITNEDHTKYYALANATLNPWEKCFMIDKRNDIWVTDYDDTIIRIHDGIPQHINIPGFPYWDAISNTSYYCITIVDDHNGNDYILGDYQQSNFPTSDSIVLTKFDGSVFTQIPMGAWARQQRTSTSGQSIFSDYAGNIFIAVDTNYMHKYSHGVWSDIATPQGSAFYDVFSTYTSQLIVDDHLYQIDSLSATWQVHPFYTAGMVDLHCSNLFYGNDSSLWLGCWDGLLEDSAGTFVVKVDRSTAPYISNEDCGYNVLMDKYGNFFSSFGTYVNYYSPAGFSAISGRVFIDTNMNGVLDSGEAGVAGLPINEPLVHTVLTTDSTGGYYLNVTNQAQIITVSFTCPPYYYSTTPSMYDAYPGSGNTSGYNFGIAPIGHTQQLQITAGPSFAVQGETATQWLTYKNSGNTTVSDTITYQMGLEYTYLGGSPAAEVSQIHYLRWAFTDLRPFETRTILMQLHLDTLAVVGDFESNRAVIYPLHGDTTPGDNVFVLKQLVLPEASASQKTVTPVGEVFWDEVLTYTIYFENTDTVPVTNIVITDTLSPYLNWSTFHFLGSSAPVSYNRDTQGVVHFTFNNIQLPDSQARAADSHGYVQYSVAVEDGLMSTCFITNTAYVSFDSSTPVATNIAYNMFLFSAIDEIAASGMLHIYPNPNNGTFTVENSNQDPATELSVIDVSGRKVYGQQMLPGKSVLSLTGLSAGVYMLIANGLDGVVARKKVIIE